MKEYIIFYTNYPIYTNGRWQEAFSFFEYDRKYEIIESYDTKEWYEYFRKIKLDNNKFIIIQYHYDGWSLSSKTTYDHFGDIVEFHNFREYEIVLVDISLERCKKITSLLES